jgi:predicted metal-dependent hydrolase
MEFNHNKGIIMETDVKVQYTLRRRAGQRRVYLRIQSDGSLLVTAGEHVSKQYIDSLVLDKWDWYLKNRRTKTVSHDYKDGDSFSLLGRTVVLETVIDAKRSSSMVIDSRLIVFLHGKEADPAIKQRLIIEEFGRQLTGFLEIRLPFWSQKMNISKTPHFHLNNARRQWASCSSTGELSFSVKMASLDSELLDYLIVHELSHIFYMNHGPGFKALLATYIPDWEQRRKRLSDCYLDSFI